MTRRRLSVFLMALGVVLGLVVAGVVFVQLTSVEQLRAAAPKTWVVVAVVDIPERSTITVTQLAWAQVPDTAIPVGSVLYQGPGGADLVAKQEDLFGRVKDKYTSQRIYKGEIINVDRLGAAGVGFAPSARSIPSADIPKGKVLYTFPVKLRGGSPPNESVLIAILNAVRPGDFIDIYYTSFEPPAGLSKEEEETARTEGRSRHLFTRRLFQNLKVVNVGFFPDATGKAEAAAREERYLTLLVSPEEALTLKWLKDTSTLEGNLEFVLRSPLDLDPFPRETVSYQTFSTQFGLGTRQ